VDRGCLHAGHPGRGVPDQQPTMRAERAKPKSWRDDEIIAQGKRGTSAALGRGSKMNPVPSSRFGLPRPARGKPNREEGRQGLGWRLPRAAASASLPWAIISLPLRGAGGAWFRRWAPCAGREGFSSGECHSQDFRSSHLPFPHSNRTRLQGENMTTSLTDPFTPAIEHQPPQES
jgi:hypothetical protein